MYLSLGNRIRELRKLKQLSQEEIAEQCGVSPSSVSRWETGNLSPSYKHLTQLAKVLDIDISDFYTSPETSVPKSVVLSEILNVASELSVKEQNFLLDIARSLKNLHLFK